MSSHAELKRKYYLHLDEVKWNDVLENGEMKFEIGLTVSPKSMKLPVES